MSIGFGVLLSAAAWMSTATAQDAMPEVRQLVLFDFLPGRSAQALEGVVAERRQMILAPLPELSVR